METDGYEKLHTFLSGLSGNTCTLPMARVRALARESPPEDASSTSWWSDPSGWGKSKAREVCRAAGWRVETVYASAELIRLRRVDEETEND